MSETNTPEGTGPLTPGQAAGLLGGMLSDDAPEAAPEESEYVSEDTEEDAPEAIEAEGDVDAEDEEGAEATPPPQSDEIEIDLPDGTKAKVTRDELTKGYLRQSDYTRKTQQLAEQARQLEAASQKEAERLRETLQRIEQQFPQEQEPDWAKLAQEDPFGYVEKRAAYDARQKALSEAREQAQRVAYQQHQQAQQKHMEHVQSEMEAVRAHPLFADVASDDKQRGEREVALLKTAESLGFSQEDFSRVTDHRIYVMLEKARRYDEMIGKAKAVESSSPKAPAERKPGTARRSDPKREAISKSLNKLSQTSGRQQRNLAADILGKL